MNINETNCNKIYRKIDISCSSYQKKRIHNKSTINSNNNLGNFNRHFLNNKPNKIQKRKNPIENDINKYKHNIISFNKIIPGNFPNSVLLKNIKNIEKNKIKSESLLREKYKKSNSPNILDNKDNDHIFVNKFLSLKKNNLLKSNTILNNKKNNITSKNNEIDIFFDSTINNDDNYKTIDNPILAPKISLKKSGLKNDTFLNFPHLTEKNNNEKINLSLNSNKNCFNCLTTSKNKCLYNHYNSKNQTLNYSENKILKPKLSSLISLSSLRSNTNSTNNSINFLLNDYNNDLKKYFDYSNSKTENLSTLNSNSNRKLYTKNSLYNNSCNLENIISRTKKILKINIDDNNNNKNLINPYKLNTNCTNNLLISTSSENKPTTINKNKLLLSCKKKLDYNKKSINEYITQPLLLTENNYSKMYKKNKNQLRNLPNVCYHNLKNSKIKNWNFNKRIALDFSFERTNKTNKCNSYIKSIENLRFSINQYKNNVKTNQSSRTFNSAILDKNIFNYERITSNSFNKIKNEKY